MRAPHAAHYLRQSLLRLFNLSPHHQCPLARSPGHCLAATPAEISSVPLVLHLADPAAGPSRPLIAEKAVAKTDVTAGLPLGRQAGARSRFHGPDHKICSHIGKNVGLDDVGHTGIRITSVIRREAGLSELIRDVVGLVGGGRGGIRTHGELAPSPVFKTGSLNHSDTLPSARIGRVSHPMTCGAGVSRGRKFWEAKLAERRAAWFSAGQAWPWRDG